eukprot:COSAG03_NODE_600_length_6771_cov_188.338429_1_plen_48_part_00
MGAVTRVLNEHMRRDGVQERNVRNFSPVGTKQPSVTAKNTVAISMQG